MSKMPKFFGALVFRYVHFGFLSSTWNYLTKKPPPVEGDHLQDVIVAPEHSTGSRNTEALIQRAEALDDDKLKEKEALTTQAVE